MALVDYISSDEDDDEDEGEDNTRLTYDAETLAPTRTDFKRKRDSDSAKFSELPPLPSKFHDLYASKVRVGAKDDSSFHGGRKRITPHVEGNWPSHIYIEWYPSTAEYESLTSLITSIKNAAIKAGETEMVSLLKSDLGSPLPLHISLSRPIVFTAAEKDSFVESLHRNILGCGVRPFKLGIGNLYWVSNAEKTRWFLASQVQRPEEDESNRLLKVCNETVEDYSQLPLYASPRSASHQPPHSRARTKGVAQRKRTSFSDEAQTYDFSSSFHISMGWALEQPGTAVIDATKATMDNKGSESFKEIYMKVDAVKVKIGNVVSSIPLLSKDPEEENIYLGSK